MAKQAKLPYGDGVVEKRVTTPPELVDFYQNNGADVGIGDTGPSMTRQEFADECDINVIMAQYEKTGTLNHVAAREPMYLDLTAVPDFRVAMDMMLDAEKAFMSLPALVRKEFDNDARNFVDYAVKPENLDQMRKWGLAAPGEPPAPPAAPPATPAAPAPVEPPKAP